MTFCEVILVGNIGKDGELSYTQQGRAVCSFSLATNRNWVDRNTNERHDETTWWRVAIWGPRAESLHQYLTKGKKVLVVADRVQARAYMASDGQPKASLEVTARDIQFVGGTTGTGSAQYSDSDYPYGSSAGGNDYGGAQEVDDIPF
ncbi:MAG: single-stranded DNA-binding protein [Anaerolineae bacterium]|nr:single-stranded DNA-binding protein [Anaerolineae bacterium]